MEPQNLNYEQPVIAPIDSDTGRIRKAVIPLFESLLAKLPKQVEPSNTVIENVCKYIGAKLDSLKSTIQKVEVTNQKQPIINVVEKQIEFPKTQKVTGSVEVKKIDTLLKAITYLTDVIVEKQAPEFPYKKKELIPVKIMEMPIATQGGGNANKEEKIWLREEYTYTTISGTRVPTTIKKWDEDKQVTEVYTYEAIVIDGETIVSPITKARTVQMI